MIKLFLYPWYWLPIHRKGWTVFRFSSTGSFPICLILLCHGCPDPLPEHWEVGQGCRDHTLWLLWELASGFHNGQGPDPARGATFCQSCKDFSSLALRSHHEPSHHWILILKYIVMVAAVWGGRWGKDHWAPTGTLLVWGKTHLHSFTVLWMIEANWSLKGSAHMPLYGMVAPSHLTPVT